MKGAMGYLKNVVHNFFSVNHKLIPKFLLAAIMILSTNLIAMISNYYMGELVDSAQQWDKNHFFSVIIILAVIRAIYVVVAYLSVYFTNKVSEMSVRNIRLHTYNRIMKADMKWVNDMKIGDVISRVNSDLESMVNMINHLLTWELTNIFQLTVGVLGCFIMNWKLAIVSLLAFPILGTLQVKVSKPISNYSALRAKADGRANAKFIDLLLGQGVSKIFGQRSLENEFNKQVDESVEYGVKSAKLQFGIYPVQAFLNLLPFAIMYAMSIYLVRNNELTLGGFLTFTLLFLMVSQPMSSIAGQIGFIFEAAGLSSRIFELWNVPEEKNDGIRENATDDIPVELNQVEFSYEDNENEEKKKILNGMTFSVNKGEKVAIVGNSGEGKSTIIKLLSGFYQNYTGDVKVYGIPISEWNIEKMREHIAYVGQDVFLFPESIYDNIKFGNSDATDEQVMEVIKDLGLDSLDLHTKIGERGVKLSGGQKQRICIARALLKNVDLILLDEPTSALDTESEYLVNQAIEKLTKGRTSIIVAHRLSAIRNVDRILCIQEGKVAEEGSFEDVMKKGGLIRKLFLQQYKEGECSYE